MIKARIRWCTCRVENILTLGKLLSLWFCFLLHSILFLISQTSYRTYKIISRYELARPIMGTIFLVIYSVTKILRKIRATTFTENYGKLRVRGMSAWDERTPLPISLGSATLYLFATR